METREQIEIQIQDERRARGYAQMHGKKYDDSIITALNQRLDALVDLESAQTQQARETAQADYQSDLSAKRQRLEAMIADDLADTKEAEDAACKLAAAISRRLNRVGEMARLTHAISGGPVPIVLHFPEVMSRIGGWVGGILAAQLKPRGRLGGLQWSHVSLYPADTKSWRDEEAEAYEKHINPILGKDTTNG